MQVIRSLAFNASFYLNTLVQTILFLPVMLLPRKYVWVAVRSWARVTHFLLRVICGIRYEIRGLENIPPGGILVAPKHQSTWETYTLAALLPDPTFILKRELQWIPLFGWYTIKAKTIPVLRGSRSVALEAITKAAKGMIAEGRQIIIFPDGTRRPVGATPEYKYGVAHLYDELKVPCVPVAHNAGLYWPRRSLLFQPGTIKMEILKPIPPGIEKNEFLKRLEAEIEPVTNRLIAEGRAEIAAAKN